MRQRIFSTHFIYIHI